LGNGKKMNAPSCPFLPLQKELEVFNLIPKIKLRNAKILKKLRFLDKNNDFNQKIPISSNIRFFS
jgi:hypothetical protein